MLSEQLGLGTTASDSLPSGFPPVLEHCMWKAVTIPAVVWGCEGLLCRSELDLKNKGANCSLLWSVPRSTVLLLMGDPFFAPPGWGCSGYQWQWCSQPSTGRGWHCSLLLGAAPGLSTALAALCPLRGCDTIELAFFWRSRAVQGWQCIPWILCSLMSTGLTAMLLYQRLWSFSSFTEVQRKVQSNLLYSRPGGWIRFTWPGQVKAEVDSKKNPTSSVTNHP